METYFVIGKQPNRPPSFQRQPSHYSSLAAVVYAMAQTRKKHTGNTRKFYKKLLLYQLLCFSLYVYKLHHYNIQNNFLSFQNRTKTIRTKWKIIIKIIITQVLIPLILFLAGSAVLGRARTQQKGERKIINYSSMRITHKSGGYPVRRNTTRANHKHMHAR